ncbi:surface polysaccharide O-acyltransferase-like enzyme [Paenibacillus amylolyticus]|uniref:Surface polysaccharide O-acyltransferase-like enzyme n=1 Tax=Paenibacillus amylolyticus TaxID=1451 RepID=A0AAP5LRT5_PAEAM|nr:acyltransferase [Paenibacillus amylolyticus]MDR6727010.1 surface polysaccharide O-acyltransferase-like enzyme [Paenibacillus amylolyticus]
MSKPRIEEWTQLRGMAFLAIVMQHNIAEYIYRADIAQPDSIMLTMIYHLTRFGTPTFVFLAGVLLFYHHSHKKPDYPHFIRKRFGDIYVPFVLWTLIYWLAVRIFTPEFWQSGTFDVRSLIRELFLPQTGYHLWFVLMVFQFYVLFPLFLRAAQFVQRKLGKMTKLTGTQSVIALVLIAAALYTMLMKWSYYDTAGWTVALSPPWSTLLEYRSYSWVMYWFYFLLGAVCAWGIEHWRHWMVRALPWLICLFIGMYIWLGYDVLKGSGDIVNLNISTYLKPTTFIIIMAQMLMLYGFLVLLRSKNTRFQQLFTWIGRYSFGGYLVHALIIYCIAYVTRPLLLTGWHLPVTLLSFLVTVSISLAISWGLSKLPGSRFTVGLQRRKRSNSPIRSTDESLPRQKAGYSTSLSTKQQALAEPDVH